MPLTKKMIMINRNEDDIWRKSNCRSVICDGDEVEKEDGEGGDDDQDQGQYHRGDDRSQRPSWSFCPGLF